MCVYIYIAPKTQTTWIPHTKDVGWGRNQLKFINHQLVIPLMYFLPPRLQMGFDDFVRIGSFRSMHPAVLHKAAGNVSTRKAMTKVRLGLRFSFDVSMVLCLQITIWWSLHRTQRSGWIVVMWRQARIISPHMVLYRCFIPWIWCPQWFWGNLGRSLGTGSQELTDVLKHLEEVPLLTFCWGRCCCLLDC